MAQVERKIEIRDDNGLVEIQTIMVEEVEPIEPIEIQIIQKEQQLIKIYEELQKLKETNIPQ